jgi:two-component system sensor histidine kinase DctS
MLDLPAFIKRVTTVSAGAPGVTLLPLPNEGRLWVLADSLLLEHVVLNLVGNALDWAAKGQTSEPQVRMWLDLDHTQHTASFNVADSGPGVPDDDRERIFSAFFSTKDGGMGMGLAICRSIVEAHHGRIDVIRDPDLGGARFVIWLPLTTPPADASSQPDAATAPLAPETRHEPPRHPHR